MMAVRDEQAIETLEEVLEAMDEIAYKLRRLRNRRIEAYREGEEEDGEDE